MIVFYYLDGILYECIDIFYSNLCCYNCMGFYERKLFLIKIKMVLNCLEEVDVFKVLYFRMKEFVDKYLVMVN